MNVDVVVVGLGALGSAAAYELADRGVSVLGVEQFELGHALGASHDTSRILRHSYHTPNYVRLTKAAYDDWARLEDASGEELVTVVGGLDLFPAGSTIPLADYVDSLNAERIEFELLTAAQIRQRWPMFNLAGEVVGLFQERGAIVPAGRGTAAMQRVARERGAQLHEHTKVLRIEPVAGGYRVITGAGLVDARAVIVTADAWTNTLLRPLGVQIPLTVTEEQVTYFRPDDAAAYRDMPLWIWMDDPRFYGFPPYGEATLKTAQDCGGPVITPASRSFEPDVEMADRLASHVAKMLPGSGEIDRSVRCQYALTHDRDFVISAVPGHPGVVVGLGAAHGFKFAPTIGRLLTDLALIGETDHDLTPYSFDRPAITDPTFEPNWMV